MWIRWIKWIIFSAMWRFPRIFFHCGSMSGMEDIHIFPKNIHIFSPKEQKKKCG